VNDVSSDPSGAQQLTRPYVELALRLGALALILYWSLLLVRPFITIMVWSTILAVALYPTFNRTAAFVGGRRRFAAALVTMTCLLVVVAPAAWIVLGVLDGIQSLSTLLQSRNLTVPAPPETVKTWPLVGGALYQFWDLAFTNLREALAKVMPYLKPVGGKLLGLAGTAGTGLLEFVVSVIVAGFLLSPGPSFIVAIKKLARRIDVQRGGALVDMAGATIRTVGRGLIGISLLQAFLAGIGLFIAGVPGASLITFAVLICGIIQVGPAIVLLPVIIWAWTAMDTTAALVFTAYMVPVNLLDNVLKPVVMGRGLTTPLPIIFIGAIGGTLAHGIVGLFLGPIVLAVFWELLIAWLRDSDAAPAAVKQV
jgi:predicted PurR-regulated permease PerM